MSHKIDRNSETWLAVLDFIKAKRADAIESLVADSASEQQRGKIELLSALERLPDPEGEPAIVADNYA